MKKILLSLSFIFGFLFDSHAISNKEIIQALQKQLKFDIPIRVLIDNYGQAERKNWILESKAGFLVGPNNGKKLFVKGDKLSLTLKGSLLCLNNKSFDVSQLFILPVQGHLKHNGIEYYGIFSFIYEQGTAYLVNHVELEDYVLSVLPAESWPGWPDEVNKAFCIGFRSYGIAKVLEQRKFYKRKKIALPYDIKNTRVHQVYKGKALNESLQKIVKETQGLVLTYKNEPILAMFDICCGGIVPTKTKYINFTDAPYLARDYACSYCNNYKFYRWGYSYTAKQIEESLKHELPNLGNLKELKVIEKDSAGIVMKVLVKGSKKSFVLTGNKFKSLIKDIKSLCYTMQKRGSTVLIEGRGFGHLVGLCQRGAYNMVCRGYNYKSILKFYYPKTTLMRLKKIALESIDAKL